MDPLDSLASRLSPGAATTDPGSLAEASWDMSPAAMLRWSRPGEPVRPLVLVRPASTEDVSEALRWAEETGTPVVTRGLGSGVCGGAVAGTGSLVLDVSSMGSVLAVDDASGVVEVQAGCRGTELEAALAPHGLTTGHYPQSIALSSVGGWIAAAGAGQASAGFGPVEDLVVGLTAVLADGTVVRLRPAPRSAAGPNLRRLLVGSEGTLAVITEAVLACAPLPTAWSWSAFSAGSFGPLVDLARQAVWGGVGATIVRGWDEADTALAFASLGHPGGAVAIFGFPDLVPGLEGRREALEGLAAGVGASTLDGGTYGGHWWEHRNDVSETYRLIMGPDRIFGPGVMVDSIEVAGLWRDVPALYDRIREALLGGAEAATCHLSHPYRSGASLYFSFLVHGADEYDAEHRLGETWRAAVRACHEVGGTMTHHHGVGTLKAPFMGEELGAGGLEMLRRIKAALDPAGVLNPGKLLP